MSIYATCGHLLTEEEGLGIDLSVKDTTIDYSSESFVPCVSFGNYCKKCADELESGGLVLHDKEETDAYLKGPQSTWIKL